MKSGGHSTSLRLRRTKKGERLTGELINYPPSQNGFGRQSELSAFAKKLWSLAPKLRPTPKAMADGVSDGARLKAEKHRAISDLTKTFPADNAPDIYWD